MKLIDADAFRHRMYHEVFEKDSEDQRWDSGCWMRYRLFDKTLEEQPAVDAVPVIRCKDCRHSVDEYHDGDCYCRRPDRQMAWIGDWDFYCKAAERRQDETD